MQYRKITNLLDNTRNQPTKFRTKNSVEISGGSCGTYNTNTQIKFKTSMLRSIYVIIVMHIYSSVERQ